MLERLTEPARRSARHARDLTNRLAGGPARTKVVLLFAAVLGLNGADFATVSASTRNLEHAFSIGNTEIGLLISVVSLVAALGTLPVGVLTDRTHRTWLLAISIVVWSVALVFSGAATSYLWLLLARLALGVASATTGPTVSSLVGDFFPATDRSQIYGLILGGELVGTGIGFVVSGELSSVLSWRYTFWWLVLPGAVLAWLVWRLPEPARGGQSRLPVGADDISNQRHGAPDDRIDGAPEDRGLAEHAARRAHIAPQPELVLHTDPTNRSVWWAARYVLRIRTNLIIIIASALGYFYFAGLRSFALPYLTGHYQLTKPVASPLVLVVGVGAVVGVFAGGRLADRGLRHGHIRSRVVVAAVCLLAVTPVLAPALLTTSIAVALPLLTLGAALLGAPNPAMDAARLDIMHPRLWGRAEAVRTVLRSLGEATAPVLFGYLSEHVFNGPDSTGLEYTFLLFLIALLAAGLLVLPALRTYPRDVATASASVHAINAATAAPDGRAE